MKKIYVLPMVMILSLGFADAAFTVDERNPYAGLPQEKLNQMLRRATLQIAYSVDENERDEMRDSIDALLSAGADPSYKGEESSAKSGIDSLHRFLMSLMTRLEEHIQQGDNPARQNERSKDVRLYKKMVAAQFAQFKKEIAQRQDPPPPYIQDGPRQKLVKREQKKEGEELHASYKPKRNCWLWW